MIKEYYGKSIFPRRRAEKRVETIPDYVIDAFNDLYSDVTITYYRISTAVIGYARFVRNCQNEAKLLTKSGEILVGFGKSNLLNETFFGNYILFDTED